MDVPSWIGAICAVVTVLGAGVSWWRSTLSKQAKDASEQARDEARRGLEAVKRKAVSLQQLAEAAEERKAAPPWRPKWQKGDLFELINAGNRQLSDLKVDIDVHGETFTPLSIDVVDAKSSVIFMYSQHMGSDPSARIVVTWARPDGIRSSWRHPIPPHGVS